MYIAHTNNDKNICFKTKEHLNCYLEGIETVDVYGKTVESKSNEECVTRITNIFDDYK